MQRLSILLAVSLLFALALTGCGNPPPAVKLTPAVEEAISLARSSNSYSNRDDILLRATSQAVSLADFKALAYACNSLSNRDSILMQGASKAASTDDYLELARACNSYSNRDSIIVLGASHATTVPDMITLARACNSLTVRDNILWQAAQTKACGAQEFKDLAYACNSYSMRDRILTLGSSKTGGVCPAPTGTGTSTGDSPVNGDQALKAAYDSMMAAQKAYNDAIARGAHPDTITQLAKEYQALRANYENLLKSRR